MNFLLNTITFWEEPPRARHQVAFALSQKYPVVFIAGNKFGFMKLIEKKIDKNLTLIQPFFPIDNRLRYRISIVNKIYQKWLFRLLRKKFKEYHVINFDFTATEIFNYFDHVVYYCNDNFTAISKHINPAFIARYHKKCESIVARKSDFCISVSTILKDNLLHYNRNSFEIPLGSPDISKYKIKVNKTCKKEGLINVGLVGFIKTYNVSYSLINVLLMDNRIQVTLIGPVEDKFLDCIENKEKLTVKGSLTGRQLYEEINKFDVAIAAYSSKLLNDVHVGTGSKMYQYFALGKPIVISKMIGLTKVEMPDKFIYIAENESEFLNLIIKALEENTPALIEQRIDYANNNTWEKRIDNLLEYYRKVN